MPAVNATRPCVGGSQSQGLDNSGQAGGHNRRRNSTIPNTSATAPAHRDCAWWRLEARLVGSDWSGVLALHAAVVAAWRARHDHGSAASNTASTVLDPRAVVGALGGRMVSRHGILAPDPSYHDAIVLAEALPITAQAGAA